MSKKSTKDSISGVVMIAVFLALYYGSEKIEWFNQFDKTMRGVVLLICALVLFLIVKFIFNIRQGLTKELIIQNAVLLVASVAFIVIALLLKNTNVNETVLFVLWAGVPILLVIMSTPPVKRFIKNLTTKKDED